MAMLKHRKVGEKSVTETKRGWFLLFGKEYVCVVWGMGYKLLAWPTLVNFAGLNQLPRRF